MRVPANHEDESVQVRIISHNIRYATTNPFPGELPWSQRRHGLTSELLYHTRHCLSSFVCLQEVLHSQLLDILTALNAASPGEWSYIGVGRDDGKEQGEYSPILYRHSVWTLERCFTTWLSPTPQVVGSKGWDAASVRILTTGLFVHVATGKAAMAMNTHLDDQGSISRKESAKLILETIENVALETTYDAAFLAGDLNSEPTGEAYQVLNGQGTGTKDVQSLGNESPRPYGNEMTFTGFNGHGDGDDTPKRIDFVHLGMSSSYYLERHRKLQWSQASLDTDENHRLALQEVRREGHGRVAPGNARSENSHQSSIETGKSDIKQCPDPGSNDLLGTSDVLKDFDFDSFLTKRDPDCKRRAEAEYTESLSQRLPWKCQGYAVLPNRFDDGVYISDHRAVVADLLLK